MGDIERVVKKYFGDEEVIFDGNVDVDGIKIAKGKANAALFVDEFDDMKIGILDPGVRILIAVPNRDYYINHLTGKDWSKKGSKYRLVEWKFDPLKGVVVEKIITHAKEDERKIRAYTPVELREKLQALNVDVNAVFTDVDSEEYVPDLPVLFAYGVKKEEEVEGVTPEEVELEDITPEGVSPEVVEKSKDMAEKNEIPVKAATAAVVGTGVAARVRHEDEDLLVTKKPATKSKGAMPRGIYGLRLYWIDSNKKEHELEVDKDIIIGRGRGDVLTIVNKMGKKKYAPMMVFDYDKKISRKHVEIITKDGQWYIRDLGSTNGTAVNGIMLPGWKKPSGGNRYPSEEVLLKDGDIITLANTITIQVNVYLKQPLEEAPNAEEIFEEPKEEFREISERKVAPVAGAVAVAAKKSQSQPVEEFVGEDESGEFVEEKVEKPVKKAEIEVPEVKPCMLKWVDGNLRPHEIEISDDVYIGKRTDNNVVFLKTKDGKVTIPLGIIDLEDEISEKHLELHFENGKWYIKDLGSKRGTIVGGDYLPGWKKGKESEYVELKDNDEILIGKYLITVKIQ